jgi:hypothetical protein
MRIGRRVLSILISIQLLSLSHARNCSDGGQALARITPRGLEKVVGISLKEAIPYIHDGVKEVEPIDFEVKADREKCSADKVRDLEIGQSYKVCPGFPRLLVEDDGIALSEIKESAKAVPSDFDLKNFGVKDIKLGKPTVNCDGVECDIEIPVDKFQVTGDFKAREMGKKKDYLDIDGLSVTVKSTKEKRPKLKFKAKLGADGTLENFVSFPQDFLGAELGMENLSIGVGGRENLQEFANESLENIMSGDYLGKVAEDFAELAAQKYGPEGEYKHLSKDERYKLAQKYVMDKMDFTAKQITESAVNTGMERALSHTKGDLSTLTYLVADGLTSSELPIMDVLLQRALPMVTKEVEQVTRENLAPFTKELPFVHDPFKVELPNIKAQDIVNSEQIDYFKKKISIVSKSCQEKFKRRKCRLKDMNKLERLLKDSSDTSDLERLGLVEKELRALKKHLEANPSEGFFSNKKPKENLVKNINKFLAKIPNIEKKIQANSQKKNEQLALEVAVKQVVSANENLDILVSACSSGCTDINISDVQARSFPDTDKEYDLAVTLNLESVNDYIEAIQKQGMLDVCLVEGIMVHCGDLNLLGTENKISFKKPPRIEWNEEKKEFLLKIDDIHRNQDIVGIPSWMTGSSEYTSIEIPFDIKVSEDGKEFSLNPRGEIKTDYDSDKKGLILPTVLTFAVAPYAGLAFEVLHRGAHSAILELGEDAVAEGVGTGVRLEDDLPVRRVVDIHHNGQEVTVFTEIVEDLPK